MIFAFTDTRLADISKSHGAVEEDFVTNTPPACFFFKDYLSTNWVTLRDLQLCLFEIFMFVFSSYESHTLALTASRYHHRRFHLFTK